MEIAASEVLILDTNTFIAEIGLTSRHGSAMKHYLYRRGMQLVVPEVVAEECERNLIGQALKRRKRIESDLQWLARFSGGVNGWQGPDDESITERAKALVQAEHLGAVVIPETVEVQTRAKSRNQSEQPPSHKSHQLADCRIWEQCLDLLACHRVVFVSNDGDFRGQRHQDKLHPILRTEAETVAEGGLAFHRTIESLLSELKSEIQPLPNSTVFDFVYRSIAAEVANLKSRSGCHPKEVGEVKQTFFTTERPDVVEVRMEVTDTWECADKAATMDFRFSGSSQYCLAGQELRNLKPLRVSLLMQEPDGAVRAVKGSYVGLSATLHVGVAPIRPGPEELELS